MRNYLVAVGLSLLLIVGGILLVDLAGVKVFGYVVFAGVLALVAMHYFGFFIDRE